MAIDEVRIKLEVDLGVDEPYQGQSQHDERFETNRTEIEDGEEEEIEWPPALSTIKQEEEVDFKLYFYSDSQDVDNSSEIAEIGQIPIKKISIDDMVLESIKTLKARNGSSLHAIKKVIGHTYTVEEDTQKATLLRKSIVKLVHGGKLTQIRGPGANCAFKITVPGEYGARPTEMSGNTERVQSPPLQTEASSRALGRTGGATFDVTKSHKKGKHSAKKEPKPRTSFFCRYCKYHRDYVYLCEMRSHIKHQHKHRLESIPCQDCKGISVNKLQYRFHRLSHTNFWGELGNQYSPMIQLEKEICFTKKVSIKCPLPSCNHLPSFKTLEDFERHVNSTVHGGLGVESSQETLGFGTDIKEVIVKQEEDIQFLGVVRKNSNGIFPDL